MDAFTTMRDALEMSFADPAGARRRKSEVVLKMIHDWRTLIPSNDPRHVKRGSEIEVSIPKGDPFRFAIYTVWVSHWEKDPFAPNGGYLITDCTYRVRDAHTVSDAQVKAGVRPLIVFEAPQLDQVETWLAANVEVIA